MSAARGGITMSGHREARSIASTSLSADELNSDVPPPAQGIKFAVVIIATIPVLLAYPFLQKHFAKGMLIGSVKG